jgi:hypothetical protein
MKEALRASETRFLPKPHGVTTQQTIFFMVTAVKISNLTNIKIFLGSRARLARKSDVTAICEHFLDHV